MASLKTHLSKSDDHGRLGFHPACPVCRDERLAGELVARALVSRRAQALVSVGVLAFSSALPAVPALAVDSDHEVVGTSDGVAMTAPGGNLDAGPADDSGEDLPADPGTPADTDTGDPAASPTPGASDAVTSGTGQAQPSAPDTKTAAAAPTEAAQPTDPASASLPGVNSSTLSEPQATPGVGSAPELANPDATGPSAPPSAAISPAQSAPSPEVAIGERRGRFAAEARIRHSAEIRRLLTVARATARVVRPAEAAQPAEVNDRAPAAVTNIPVAQAAILEPTATDQFARRATPGDRVHGVLAGESLWSIANDLLGGRATVAQVAREVNRLWELNRARIGTGDRDLLPVGTRLELK